MVFSYIPLNKLYYGKYIYIYIYINNQIIFFLHLVAHAMRKSIRYKKNIVQDYKRKPNNICKFALALF